MTATHAKAHSGSRSKPMMRGHVHQAGFFFFLGAGIMLVMNAHSSLSRTASIIYVLSLTCLFGVSALYHRPHWGNDARKWLRRLDHSSIYILIAGSATPIMMLGLEESAWPKIVLIIWSVALAGILKCFFWTSAPKFLNVVLYIAAGWLAVPYFASFKFIFNRWDAFLLFGGGVIYCIGAAIYFFKRPDPYPKFFGYHEIFHVLVFIAGSLHFLLIYNLMLSA